MLESQFNVRVLGESDFAGLLELRREALQDAPTAFLASETDDFLSNAASPKDVFQKPNAGLILGAGDTRLLGMLGTYRQSQAKAAHKSYLWGMYVRPVARRTGLGEALIRTALFHLRQSTDVSDVQISVTAAAPEARRLYERIGFRLWGMEPNALRYNGESFDEYHLHMALNDRT